MEGILSKIPDYSRGRFWINKDTTKILSNIKTRVLMINRHTSLYWNDKHPHQIKEEESDVPGVTVWAHLSRCDWAFFHIRLCSCSCLELPQRAVMPENEQRRDVESAVREQDAAPLHSRQETADVACQLGAEEWPKILLISRFANF